MWTEPFIIYEENNFRIDIANKPGSHKYSKLIDRYSVLQIVR